MRAIGLVLIAVFLSSCAAWQTAKPIVKSVDDVARQLCALHFSEKATLSLEEAAEFYCNTREQFEPWIGPALEAQKLGAVKSEARRK